MGNATLNDFMLYVTSDKTKDIYRTYFDYFTRFVTGTGEHVTEDQISTQLDNLLSMQPKEIQNLLAKYIVHMKSDKLSYSSMRGRVAPLVTFLQLNDILVNTKKLYKLFGEQITKEDDAYTMDDIHKLMSVATNRGKLIISILSSTGIRKGALIECTLKQIEKIPELGLYKFKIYPGTKYHYVTYCTSECGNLIDNYLQMRQKAGEILTGESPLLRNNFDVRDPERVKNVKFSSPHNLNTMFLRFLKRAGIRKSHPKADRYPRQDIQIFHGFRKFFNSTLVKSNLNPVIKEKLMGHHIGLDNSYLRMSDDEMLSEYLKAVNELTIDPTNRLKNKISFLEQREKEIHQMKIDHKRELDELKKDMESQIGKIMARIDVGKLK